MKFRALAIALVIPWIAHASTFFVESAGGTYTPGSEAAAVTQLVRSAVHELPGHSVSTERTNADYILLPKLIPLGSAFVLTLEKWRGSKRIFTARLKAARAEELDDITHRLTRAVVAGVAPKDDLRVGEISETEAAGHTRRREARSGTFLALGPAGFGNQNTSSLAVYVAAAYVFDVNFALVKLRADAAFGGGAFLVDFGLGAQFFLSERDFAPFVGVDFGYGFARADGGALFGDTVTGFVLAPVAGVQILRTTSINLEVAARAGILFESNAIGKPMLFALRVGLYF